MTNIFLIGTWVLVSLNNLAYSQSTVSVNTRLGSITGVADTVLNITVYQFRKIPFAKPPVGQLRFKKPQKFESWNNTLDATSFGPSCMQSGAYLPNYLPNHNVSEDCLFLNIYVPRTLSKTNKRSVIIWVHGGAYLLGQAMAFDGSYLALNGDVIVVTINYRLGIFGFLSLGGSPALGNYGLWDQKMAFEWVHTNIDSFGGNPSSVTIFGESAGACSVGLHALHSGNKGLFHRIIEDSGVGNSYVAYTRNKLKLANYVGMSMNCGNLSSVSPQLYIECLQTKPANALQNVTDIFANRVTAIVDITIPLGPVIDGDFIMDDPIKQLQNKSSDSYSFFRSLDVMAGTMDADGSLVLSYTQGYQPIFHFNLTKGIPTTFLCNQMAPALARNFYESNPNISNAICNKYEVRNGNDVNLSQQSRKVVDVISDVYFVSPTIQSLNFHSSTNIQSRTFQFLFTAGSPFPDLNMPPWFHRAKHSSELVYLFGLQAMTAVPSKYLKLSDAMLKYWTNFAKNGNPNDNSLPNWPEYNPSRKSYLHLDTNITQENNLYSTRVNFWLKQIPEILKNNSNGDISTASVPAIQSSTSGQPWSHSTKSQAAHTTTNSNSSGMTCKLSILVFLLNFQTLVFV